MAPSRSGAGGKIVTDRRMQRLSATPYDRPPPPPFPAPLPNMNNWFTGVISGAGKIVSSIFSEELESSSSDEASISEDDDGNDNEYENPNDGLNALGEKIFTSSEMMQYRQESQLAAQRTETKHIIEQLIMQETFSREECDRLVNVLNSRVSNQPKEAREKSLLVSPEKTVDHDDVDIFNKAVLEAKKWFQDKKVGSSSGSKLTQWSFNRNSAELEHVQNEGGSPVDVARSYMKDRPPWASPTKSIELGTPSTSTLNLFKEGTLNSVGHDSLTFSKKRNSLASGSWNIQEELRRVRSKATEDMLRTPPKIDPSWFAVAPSRKDSVGPDKVVSVVGERPTGPESFRNVKQKEALVDAGVSFDPSLAALESRQDGKPSETPSSKPATSVSGNNELFLKTSEAVQLDECAASKVSQLPSPTHAEEQHTVLQASKINGSSATEVTEHGGKQNVNGTSASQESLSAGAATGQNHEQYDENNNQNGDSTSVRKSGAYVEVPIVTETNSIASAGVQEELSVDMVEPSKKRKSNAVVRKPGKVGGRGRGRGK